MISRIHGPRRGSAEPPARSRSRAGGPRLLRAGRRRSHHGPRPGGGCRDRGPFQPAPPRGRSRRRGPGARPSARSATRATRTRTGPHSRPCPDARFCFAGTDPEVSLINRAVLWPPRRRLFSP